MSPSIVKSKKKKKNCPGQYFYGTNNIRPTYNIGVTYFRVHKSLGNI